MLHLYCDAVSTASLRIKAVWETMLPLLLTAGQIFVAQLLFVFQRYPANAGKTNHNCNAGKVVFNLSIGPPKNLGAWHSLLWLLFFRALTVQPRCLFPYFFGR